MPDGSTKTLSNFTTNFMRVFPDGNAYLGLATGAGGDYGLGRYLPSTDNLDQSFWSAEEPARCYGRRRRTKAVGRS